MKQPVFSEKEIELIDFINIIWKRKWLIIIPSLFLVILIGALSFLLPKKWEVDAIIQPSKFIIRTEQGQFEEIIPVMPKQIANQINQKAYNNIIADELKIDIINFPNLKAVNIQDTNLVQVSIREKDTEKAKRILQALFEHLKTQLDDKVDVETKSIDSSIKSLETEKLRIGEEIKLTKNKLNIVKQGKEGIEKEMNDTRKRVKELEEEQRLYLKKQTRSESESLAMLLYSNEIQQSLMNYNTLNELLTNKRLEEEDINLEIENKEEKIKQLGIQITDLNDRKRRIDNARLIKKPTASLSPVTPNKKLIVAVTGIIGPLIFTMLAFFLEYIEKKKG